MNKYDDDDDLSRSIIKKSVKRVDSDCVFWGSRFFPTAQEIAMSSKVA